MWLHNLLHKHIHLTRENIGHILFCQSKISRRLDAKYATFVPWSDNTGGYDIGPDVAHKLAECKTESDAIRLCASEGKFVLAR